MPHMSSDEVVQFRMRHKLGEKGLADILGVTFQAVRLWEQAKRGVPTTQIRLMKLFDRHPELMAEFKTL